MTEQQRANNNPGKKDLAPAMLPKVGEDGFHVGLN
jgi:hypothetical protein